MGNTRSTTPVTQDFSGRCLERRRIRGECADNMCLFSSLNDLVQKSFKRLPTPMEWTRFRKYARRMRELKKYDTRGSPSPEVCLVIQLRAINERLFPKLKTLHLWGIEEAFIPFIIPLFLSPRTTSVELSFASNLPKSMVASVITTLPTPCPNLQAISLEFLPRDPIITAAVSGIDRKSVV